jgi:hypothetical protein
MSATNSSPSQRPTGHVTHTNTDFGSGVSRLRYARRPVTVSPAELQRGDWVRDRGRSRVVADVAQADDAIVVEFAPEAGFPDRLTVSKRVKVVVWRER